MGLNTVFLTAENEAQLPSYILSSDLLLRGRFQMSGCEPKLFPRIGYSCCNHWLVSK